jgi:hypothetical protein
VSKPISKSRLHMGIDVKMCIYGIGSSPDLDLPNVGLLNLA